MLPSSDELESVHTRLDEALRAVEQAGTARLQPTSVVVATVGSLAKDWLRLSPRIRAAGLVDQSVLADCDARMSEILAGQKAPQRADTHYRKQLKPVVRVFTEHILIPVIKYEGSPHQVAKRDLQAALDPYLTAPEKAYVEEALKCVGESCNRAAIVLLWAAAITRLHGSIENRLGFPALNRALENATKKSSHPFTSVRVRGPINSRPELQRVPDFAILVAGMELWQYDFQAFGELSRQLDTRNASAHPGMAAPGLLDVQHFTDKLIGRVFKTIPA